MLNWTPRLVRLSLSLLLLATATLNAIGCQDNSTGCCMVCNGTCACGNTCIDCSMKCTIGKGCACTPTEAAEAARAASAPPEALMSMPDARP